MTEHILSLVHQRQQEITLAKAKLAQTPREVANIIIYRSSLDTPILMRYTDKKQAEQQFNKLLEAADSGRPIVLSGPTSTMAIRFPQHIEVAYLVMVEDSNFLMADTQKRLNAMMQVPVT